MKILVAMDSMKGCMDSYHACLWVATGLQDALPDAEVCLCPVSDGGEGMTEMVSYGCSNLGVMDMTVMNPIGIDVSTDAVIIDRCGYLNFASAAGLTLIIEDERNPLNTTSYGVGQMIKILLNAGIRDIRLGLGGSATVDAGLGALQALGLRLLDAHGNTLPIPFKGSMLPKVNSVEFTDHFGKRIHQLKLTLLCDVEAPFTGNNGAARIFAPQKGASPEETEFLEKGMESVRQLIIKEKGIDLNSHPGSGAAGGAAGGLMAFAGGKIKKGASTLLDLMDFDSCIDDVDLIITGEGSSDMQTLMGKIPYEILLRGKRNNIPVWLVSGRIRDKEALEEAGFEKIICINSPDIVARSRTIGCDPMDPEVASRRLSSIMNY